MNKTAVWMHGITKTFPGLYRSVIANDRVELTISQGEIHAVIGENGAGKSTLVNILYGLLQPDEGEIVVFGETLRISSPRVAIAHGIGMIHQHFMLIPSFTVGENIVLGDEPKDQLLLDRRAIGTIVRELSSQLGLPLDPDARIQNVSVGIQQRVEILKTLYRGAKILVLDEPTAVLTPQEVQVLFDALRAMAAQGRTILIITHKLPEVMALADSVTVMRNGKVVGQMRRGEFTESQLAELMTGRILAQDHLPRVVSTASPVLQADELSCTDDRGITTVRGVSFVLRGGEILGIAGVAQNGQEELAEVLTGQRPWTGGSVHFGGRQITTPSPRALRELGMGHIPDDRYAEGCARDATVARNLLMSSQRNPRLGGRILLHPKAIALWARALLQAYDVKLDHDDVPMASLSGGNAQKVIVAREMQLARRCLIAEQPSRGIDIGASEFIYHQMQALRDRGVGILLISMDLQEIFRLCDRILVMSNGQIVGERRPEETTSQEIGLLMAGVNIDGQRPPSHSDEP